MEVDCHYVILAQRRREKSTLKRELSTHSVLLSLSIFPLSLALPQRERVKKVHAYMRTGDRL